MDERQEEKLFSSLVYLADSLVSDFDVVDLSTRLVETCQELLQISAAGIMLDDQRKHLRVLASSTEDGHVLELMELQNKSGPCLDAFTSGEAVAAPNLAESSRWPEFAAAAGEFGIVAAYAQPLRLRKNTIGALNHHPGPRRKRGTCSLRPPMGWPSVIWRSPRCWPTSPPSAS